MQELHICSILSNFGIVSARFPVARAVVALRRARHSLTGGGGPPDMPYSFSLSQESCLSWKECQYQLPAWAEARSPKGDRTEHGTNGKTDPGSRARPRLPGRKTPGCLVSKA